MTTTHRTHHVLISMFDEHGTRSVPLASAFDDAESIAIAPASGASRGRTRRVILGILTLLLVCIAQSATAIDESPLPNEQPSSHIPLGAQAVPPFGHSRHCAAAPHHCRPVPSADGFAPTASRMAELARVNRRVNRSITYRPDGVAGGELDRWEVRVQQGDCEDYALTKRAELIDRGWPSHRLLIALAMTEDGTGHAVVVVRLEDRDVVLDSLHDRIVPWHATSHRFIKIQSRSDPADWYAVRPANPASTTTIY
jgi:predicted transglutaminase-like cysteine proteinase